MGGCVSWWFARRWGPVRRAPVQQKTPRAGWQARGARRCGCRSSFSGFSRRAVQVREFGCAWQ
ncbi:hypothetical protein STTU_1755 [Streptomyces sp. Tu6071]|nr:hypothetical protein STTU_1755 [Streptomyces sp. Tu6071]